MDKFSFISSVLSGLCPATAFLQDKKSPVYMMSLEDAVRPGMMDQYMQATGEWIALLKKEKVPASFSAFLESDGIVNYLETMVPASDPASTAPIESLARFHQTESGRKRQSAVRWSRYSVWIRSERLSCAPENPDAPPGTLPYFVWKHIRVCPGRESAFEDAAAAFREIFRKKGVRRGYGVFRNIIGYERPWYTVIFAGTDPGDLYAWQIKMKQELGSQAGPVLERIHAVAERITDGSGWTVPELSYTNR